MPLLSTNVWHLSTQLFVVCTGAAVVSMLWMYKDQQRHAHAHAHGGAAKPHHAVHVGSQSTNKL